MTVLFISGTGTGVGKTWVTRGMARSLVLGGVDVVALKPIETGCDPDPVDALALARACRRPEVARAEGFYRARAPLAPFAAALEGEHAPDLAAIVAQTRALLPSAGVALVEGAGGLFVPLDEHHDMADLARALGAPVVLVAADRLGVLSDVLGTCELALLRGLRVAAVVLTEIDEGDGSRRTNQLVLERRLTCPVLRFTSTADDDELLAAQAVSIVRVLGLVPERSQRQ